MSLPRYEAGYSGEPVEDDEGQYVLYEDAARALLARLTREQVIAAFGAHEGNDCCDPRTLEHVFQTLTGATLGRVITVPKHWGRS